VALPPSWLRPANTAVQIADLALQSQQSADEADRRGLPDFRIAPLCPIRMIPFGGKAAWLLPRFPPFFLSTHPATSFRIAVPPQRAIDLLYK